MFLSTPLRTDPRFCFCISSLLFSICSKFCRTVTIITRHSRHYIMLTVSQLYVRFNSKTQYSFFLNLRPPHVRLLEQFDLMKNLVGWVLDFLTNRTQRVRVSGVLSDQICSSIGSPQGCVLSPLLFILYTNMGHSSRGDRFILKYADDSVIVSLLHGNKMVMVQLLRILQTGVIGPFYR